jgi:hypothetical protein
VMESDQVLERLGVTAEEIFGYVYSGTVLGLLWWRLRQPEVEEFVDSVGGVVFAFGCLLLGVGVYALYTRVLGDLGFFPLQHLVHRFVDTQIFRCKPHESTSPIGVLRSMGVQLGHRRTAYNAIKSEFLPLEARRSVVLAHAELLIIYITGAELLGAACVCALGWSEHAAMPLVIAGSSVTVAAMTADTKQHMQDAAQIRGHDRRAVAEFLASRGIDATHVVVNQAQPNVSGDRRRRGGSRSTTRRKAG